MRVLLLEKAWALGIFNADDLDTNQLELEVMYASLNPEGRYQYEGRHGVPDVITRTCLPDPVYISGYGRVV